MEEEVFEIVDFTSASEWEFFTSKVEEILLSWQLSTKEEEHDYQPMKLNGPWKSTSEDISFAGFPFIITHHWAEEVMENSSDKSSVSESKNQVFGSLSDVKNDFQTKCHPLAYFYGLGEFVIITPSGNETLDTESRINLVLSSITIAVNSTQCRAPVFVQAHSKSQQFYTGIYETKGIRTDFEMVHLKRSPPHCNHLTGLINLFKEKIGNVGNENRVNISVSWTYSISDDLLEFSSAEHWPQAPPDFDTLHGVIGISSLSQLGFGATKDPIKEIRVSSFWSSLNEDVVVDSEVYTDLDPIQAPLWVAQIELNDHVPSLLYKSIENLLDSCRSRQTIEQLLGKNYTVLQSPDSPEYGAALGALTNQRAYSLISRNPLVNWNNKDKKPNASGGPISEKMLVTLLNFLFPDAEDQQKNPYPKSFPPDFPANVEKDADSWKDCFSGLKSAPVDSLVWRLALVMIYTNTHLNSVEGVAHLWHEIVLELRYRWENGYIIPGLERGVPDLNYSRLYQKLQMLNCCINHRNGRSSASATTDAANEMVEEDEFFDAVEDAASTSSSDQWQSAGAGGAESTARYSAWNQPQGRKEKTKLKLLKTAETLYIPVTQDSLPMTEDTLEEMESMLAQLGTDAEGSELRARLMSASLLSDMEAFKAANPGAVMEDFVRWHSPRDWIDEEVITSDGSKIEGRLSGRMQMPGNLWREMWDSSKPVVAWRQKRLFDDTKEAEKILHSFSAMKPAEVTTLLLPTAVHAAIYRLLEELVPELKDVTDNCRKAINRTVHVARHTPLELEPYEEILPFIKQSEVRLSQYKSLHAKMTDGNWDGINQFVTDLLIHKHVPLPGGSHNPAGSMLLKALRQAKKADEAKLPEPSKKEFILRTPARRPGKGSKLSCQKLYCSIEKGTFRLAGAFSLDTMFY